MGRALWMTGVVNAGTCSDKYSIIVAAGGHTQLELLVSVTVYSRGVSGGDYEP